MTTTDAELSIMSWTIWAEARTLSIEEQTGIAWTIRNRTEISSKFKKEDANKPFWWGEGIIGICQAPYQYPAWLPEAKDRAILGEVDAEDDDYAAIKSLCTKVMHGSDTDPTNGATHYTLAYVLDFPTSWGPIRDATAEIGRYNFYNLFEEEVKNSDDTSADIS